MQRQEVASNTAVVPLAKSEKPDRTWTSLFRKSRKTDRTWTSLFGKSRKTDRTWTSLLRKSKKRTGLGPQFFSSPENRTGFGLTPHEAHAHRDIAHSLPIPSHIQRLCVAACTESQGSGLWAMSCGYCELRALRESQFEDGSANFNF